MADAGEPWRRAMARLAAYYREAPQIGGLPRRGGIVEYPGRAGRWVVIGFDHRRGLAIGAAEDAESDPARLLPGFAVCPGWYEVGDA